ncbi:MAG TPA: hypothetical protein VFJ47_11135 [Terriglobales bacterium]|nr:hypothetical protein [Terriglobales bacterium]
MNPDYLWFTGTIELVTLFVIAPLVSIVIAYAAWQGKPWNFNSGRYGVVCVASVVIAVVMFVFAKWMNADVRTAAYLLQLTCFLLSFLLLGVGAGCVVPVLLRAWGWHKASRLRTRA